MARARAARSLLGSRVTRASVVRELLAASRRWLVSAELEGVEIVSIFSVSVEASK